MSERKFVDLSREEQTAAVRSRFCFRPDQGWCTPEGAFVGKDEGDVIAALIDLEEAEINAIGDCMTGCCMVQPRLEDFVRKP